jgi:hypothetical protein
MNGSQGVKGSPMLNSINKINNLGQGFIGNLKKTTLTTKGFIY